MTKREKRNKMVEELVVEITTRSNGTYMQPVTVDLSSPSDPQVEEYLTSTLGDELVSWRIL